MWYNYIQKKGEGSPSKMKPPPILSLTGSFKTARETTAKKRNSPRRFS